MFYLDFFDEILKFLAYIHLFRDTSSIISFIIAIKFPLQGSTISKSNIQVEPPEKNLYM